MLAYDCFSAMQSEIFLSVVVPVYNEQDCVADLHREILQMAKVLEIRDQRSEIREIDTLGSPISDLRSRVVEIIFVNDGSSDKTFEVLKTLSPVKIVNLRRNFGQTAAMDAGIKVARGRYIATLDGDGQNDPADIPALIRKLEAEGLDVVNGWRKERMDKTSKRWASRAQAWLRKHVLDDGVHDSGCSLKLYKRECFEGVYLYGEMHRFIAAILKMRGFKVGEEVVNHRSRSAGKSKYGNVKRMIKGNLDMFAVWFWQKYAARPLHVFGSLGVFMMTVSVVSGCIAIYKKLFAYQDLSNSAMTELSMFGFFIGVVLFCFGLISDMLMRNYYESTHTRPYVVKEVVEKN